MQVELKVMNQQQYMPLAGKQQKGKLNEHTVSYEARSKAVKIICCGIVCLGVLGGVILYFSSK